MPITDRQGDTSIDPKSITIKRDSRQREEIDVSDLIGDIRKRGIIQPIIIDEDRVLVAGERRLTCALELGLPLVPIRWAEGLSATELDIIELQENLKRKDLPWKDQTNAIQKIHANFLDLDPEWTMSQTAEELSMSLGNVSLYLKVAEQLPEDFRLQGAKTAREAYNVLARRDQRAMGAALEELFEGANELAGVTEAQVRDAEGEVVAPPESILNLSFLDWAPLYSGPKFNLIHCDFPYGVDLFAGPQGQGADSTLYADTRDVYFELLDCLLTNLDRLLGLSGHLMFWYSFKYDRETKDLFRERAASLEFSTWPLIWGKSDNAGIIADPRRDFRHTYECCLVARRGARNILRSVADFYHAPTDRSLHPSTKPEPVLRHFMTGLVDETTLMLDPTCGSGSSLRAAESLGAKTVLGLEISPEHYEVAKLALSNFRKLRAATVKL